MEKAVVTGAGQSERDVKRHGYDSCCGYDTCFGPMELTFDGLPVPVEQALSLRTKGEIRERPTD
jgi:hypothetical protein